MKKKILKNCYGFILMIIGVFSIAFVNAQTCKGNKVWTCRTCRGLYGTTYQECDCVDANKIATWLASPCSSPKTNNGGGGGQNYCDKHPCGCICARSAPGTTPIGESSGGIYPNPLVNSTTINISLESEQKVSLRIFDMSGRLVKTLAEKEFTEGEHQIVWDAANVKTGIYLLRMETENYSENRKLIVTK